MRNWGVGSGNYGDQHQDDHERAVPPGELGFPTLCVDRRINIIPARRER
jgi:hypothetical protein